MEQNEKGKGEIKEAETGAGRGPEESPETLEPREKRTKAEAAPPGHLPSLGNLKNLLEETNKAVAVAKMTNQEIDELVTKHQETERRLRQAEQLRKKRIARVESFDPLRKAEPSDYDLLLREGIIDDFAKLHGAESPKIAKETLQTLDKTIAEISAIKHPPPEIKTRLSELSEVRSAYHREIDGLIRQRQEEIGQRREKVKAKVIAHYAKRVEELNKLIAEIESNPKVAERLQALREQKKKEAEAREKALREEILSDCERYTQSVLARQNSAFERLAEVYRQIQAQEGAGMKEIKRRLTEITSWEISADNLRELARLMTDFRRRRQAAGGSEMSAEEKKEEQMIKSRLAKIRKLVETSIVDGEGKWRINHLAEIMPWEVTRSSIMYSDAISELSDAYNKEALRKLAAEGNKRAAIALENMEAATINNSLLREIYGKYRVYDKKTGELLLGWAWQAMEERRVNDAMGITGRRREERKMAERYEEEFDSAAAEIVKRGGFIMDNIPIIENVKGLKKRVGKGKCAVRLEKKKSQLRRDASGKVVGGGNDYLEVVEFVGIITKPDGGIEKVREIMGLRSGITSTLDMRGFPEWFREQLARASAKKDKDIGKL